MTDLVTFGNGLLGLRTSASERLATASQLDVRAGGSAAAAGVAARCLGTDTTWLSKLPDTPLGKRVYDGLGGTGMDLQVAWSNRGRQGTYFIEHAGPPRGTSIHYDMSDTAFTTISVDDFDLSPLRSADGFYVTGITLAISEAARETTANLLRAARQSETTVTLNVNYQAGLWGTDEARETLTQLFPAVDVLMVSMADAGNVLGYEIDDPPQVAHRIAATHDFTTVVVLREDRGAITWHDNVVHDHKGYGSDVVDPIGDVDAFSGAFVARRVEGDDIHSALNRATATAALKRTIPGDLATVTREEVERVVERGERL
jgi:2-dehydro-3-deoxygluconokinase